MTLTWNEGAPESTSFEVLWSKVSNYGNWMLTQENIGEIDHQMLHLIMKVQLFQLQVFH